MAVLTLTGDALALQELAGTACFLRAREHVRRGEVKVTGGELDGGQVLGRVGVGGHAQTASVVLGHRPDGRLDRLLGACTCSGGDACQHAVALALTLLGTGAATSAAGRGGSRPGGVAAPAAPVEPARPAPWERSLSALVAGPAVGVPVAVSAPPPAEVPTVALQFDWGSDQDAGRIVLRPVTRGHTGGWIRTGVSWGSLDYVGYGHGRGDLSQRHRNLMKELLALQGLDRYSYYKPVVQLDAQTSRRVWDVLAEVQEAGLPLVRAGRGADPVVVHAEPPRVELGVVRSGDELVVRPSLMVAGVDLLPARYLQVGKPAHGLAWSCVPPSAGGKAGKAVRPPDLLHLAPLPGGLTAAVADLLVAGEIRIPAADEQRFLQEYYPHLQQRVTVTSRDASVRLPEPDPPVLTLTVSGLGAHRVAVAWHWAYPAGARARTEPLWPGLGARPGRDLAAEERIASAVSAVCAGVPELFEPSPVGDRLAAGVTLHGVSTARLLTAVLPGLRELPGVDVRLLIEGPAPDYRETDSAPVITFIGQEEGSGEPDWFDLAVSVTIDDEQVPFGELFVALAQEQTHLILPSGAYFALDRPEFAQLARLIAESRALSDAPPGTVRLNRFQAGMWADVEQLGEVAGRAAAWQESVRELLSASPVTPTVPQGLKATLRPYQVQGFGWLATLFAHRLGGVLADDMGLGKTLQALALILHAREEGLARAPFLVVAPTSVVGNWALEAARFAPSLAVEAVTQTQARRGRSVKELAAGADVVVTSYTLFRLEFEQYQAADWAGLLLDEAQNVKNHQSAGYRCARSLEAPFKLAITGTPMENNLMELWSLMSITAPGLFANPTRFTDYYRTPIEKDRDAELLARLRRRIRPLLLRRTKEQVAADLPDKQEQVLELDLHPRHRAVYQTYLQRERQKVLGLLGDLRQNRFEIFRSLTLLRQASLDVSLVDGAHRAIPATKLDTLLEQVQEVAQDGHRVLVFSQFTRFLKKARDRLDEVGIEYCYLDGSTTRRAEVVARFRSGTAPVFLISLKAGGAGLNLVEADYVIVLDPWWNPATEAQAVDRAHRIGQTRKVMVYRLVAKDTIEEKVMALKARKSALIGSVLDGDEFAAAALTADDIRGLLE